jgi:Fungal Zn(2)-Cys(6) binuclear cluster domain
MDSLDQFDNSPSLTPPSTDPPADKEDDKNVKKRTKTGCLTCRTRRIKCDEGKPECNNCLRSKRQCGGTFPANHMLIE